MNLFKFNLRVDLIEVYGLSASWVKCPTDIRNRNGRVLGQKRVPPAPSDRAQVTRVITYIFALHVRRDHRPLLRYLTALLTS